jgi:phosphoribosylformylglycinamidine (FGAM) synthase PurS component
MAESDNSSTSGQISLTVTAQGTGRYLCEASSRLDGDEGPKERFHGTSSKHAIAVALEHLAQKLRMEAEAEQKVDWDAVDRSQSGKVNKKRFHVILHFERDAMEPSKFEAMMNTQMGNTVIENAEITIIQVDPDLPIHPAKVEFID